jgi:hypothetical protein
MQAAIGQFPNQGHAADASSASHIVSAPSQTRAMTRHRINQKADAVADERDTATFQLQFGGRRGSCVFESIAVDAINSSIPLYYLEYYVDLPKHTSCLT